MLKRVARLTLGLLIAVVLVEMATGLLGRCTFAAHETELSQRQVYMFNIASYLISTSLSIGFCLRVRIKNVKIPIAVVTITALAVFFIFRQVNEGVANAVIQYGIPTASITILAIKHKKGKQVAIDFFVWAVFSMLFGALLSYIRHGYVNLVHTDGVYLATIELIIISTALYVAGGESVEKTISAIKHKLSTMLVYFMRKHGRGAGSWKDSIPAKESEAYKDGETVLQQLIAYYRFYSWRTWEFWKGIMIMLFQLFVTAAGLFICYQMGHFEIGLTFVVSFTIAVRVVFKTWVHANTPIQCAFLTIFMVFHIVSGIAHFGHISLFAAVLYGVGFGWVAYEIGKWKRKAVSDAEFRERHEAKPPFKCATATAEEIRARCLAKGKSDEYASFLVDAWRSGMFHKEIGQKYGFSSATSKEYKRKRTREIEKNNDA